MSSNGDLESAAVGDSSVVPSPPVGASDGNIPPPPPVDANESGTTTGGFTVGTNFNVGRMTGFGATGARSTGVVGRNGVNCVGAVGRGAVVNGRVGARNVDRAPNVYANGLIRGAPVVYAIFAPR